MEVKRATKAGFCFGVRRAIDIATNTVQDTPTPLYTLGPLIHNPQVVDRLVQEGLQVIDNIEDVAPGTLIIRSHGVTPDIVNKAHALGFRVIDATCPFVRRAQKLAFDLDSEGYQVVVVGEKDHPEVQGIVGWTENRALVVQNTAEASALPYFPKIGVIAQTTQVLAKVEGVVRVLSDRMGEVKFCDTICNAVVDRQKAALSLASEVDLMVVVGGEVSANTRKLTELCRSTGTPTYHIETAAQLLPEWFQEAKVVGLTAGASTPDWIIEEVERGMREMENKNDITNPEADTSLEEEDVTSTEGEEMQTADVASVNTGEVVKGVVVQIESDEVLVDVGAKSEGVIPLRELSCCEISSPDEVTKVGDEIDALVVKAEDEHGRLILSKSRAEAVKAWDYLETAYKNGEIVQGTVREVVKGGLLLDLGVRAFLPASQVEMGYVEDLSQYITQELETQIIELDQSRKKVVLSRKALLEKEYAQSRQETLNTVQEGDVVPGTVRRLTNFGAFVDIGGIDGLLHISEISWHRINHPSDELKVGEELEVQVLRVDKENEKVSLSRKNVLANPWDQVEENYPVGEIVEARVVRLVPFGAFVELQPGVEGLIHISHLADWHVDKPEDVLQEDQEIRVKVLSVDAENKRIRLSLREAQKNKDSDSEGGYQDDNQGEVSIGDLFGDLLQK